MKLVRLGSRLMMATLLAVGACLLVTAASWAEDKPAADKTESKDAPKPLTEWKPLFDGKSLKGWKLSEFGNGGEVLVENGNLLMTYADGCNGITIDGDFPKMDYEVHVQARRVDGSDFFCGLTFPVRDEPCSLVLGGWGGALVGLSSVDGELANGDSNKTRQYITFKNKQWYDVRLRVTESHITVWLDDKQIIEQEVPGHKFSIHPAVTKSKPFGLCSYATTGEIRKVEVRKLADSEKKPAKTGE